MNSKIYIILFIIILVTGVVFAHPGRTDSSGCHTCRTNCTSYGLEYGEYHCHDGGKSSSSFKGNSTNKGNLVNQDDESGLGKLTIVACIGGAGYLGYKKYEEYKNDINKKK